MDFYEAVSRRRTVRQFLRKEVDPEAIRRILEAGNSAPTWNHNRNWSYVVLRTEEEKEFAFGYAKRFAEKFDADKYLNGYRPYPITLAQRMYGHAVPLQYTMLRDAPYVIIPVFKGASVKVEFLSKFNPLATIWCVIENIFLATAAEGLGCSMRIPMEDEHDEVKAKLKVPPTYMIPAFIGIGYADPREELPEQNRADLAKQVHYGRWK
ncbi:MAG: nitroreductase family protein [Sutterellaceae bacterium]|nr:nitroreductase family protein [Sutterellaceae bacterium]MDD7441416.1 nitroreductase family protein [Sutterellaceae bacterium]MDY2869054.1 nitroreductase family protein [Mesosutterella sp.]